MGAWGTAIFSDDLASDVRDSWKELLGESLSPEQATEVIIKNYGTELNDPEEKLVFWLALAASQWKTGRLQLAVKDKALQIIDSKENLKYWEGKGAAKADIRKREKVELKLKEQLLSKQPDSKRIPKVYKENSEFEIGDIFSYEHQSGKLALFRVIGIHHDNGGRSSVCELLDWFDKELPLGSISELPITSFIKGENYEINRFMLGEVAQKYAVKPERVQLISKGNKVQQRSYEYSVIFWRDLDRYLIERFEKNENAP